MAIFNYAIATGHNQTSPINVEDFLQHPPTIAGEPLSLGSVRRITLDKRIHTNGTRIVRWRWAAMSKADFQTLINTYLGGFDIESALVTIVTRDRDDNWVLCNAIMHLPHPSTEESAGDYTRAPGGAVLDLVVSFYDVTPFAAYPYSAGLLAEDGIGLIAEQGGFLLVES